MSLECDAKEGFTTVQAKLGAKQVDKLAKCTLNTYINDMVYDILNNALDKPTGVEEEEGKKVLEEGSEEQDRQLQLSSQVENYKWFPEHISTLSDLRLSIAAETSATSQSTSKSGNNNKLQVSFDFATKPIVGFLFLCFLTDICSELKSALVLWRS